MNDAASGAMEEHVVLSGTTTWRDYVLADGHIVMEKFSGATVATNYMVSDHLGSTAVLTDQTGAVVERDAYDAWGKRRNLDGSDDTACALTSQTTRGFTGHEHIDDLCLIDANARLYDPTLGRFLSPDDMIPDPADMQSLNRFSYVRNRPLSVTDPTGHDDVDPDYIENAPADGWRDSLGDTWGGFIGITDGMGDTLPGLVSWGSSAAGVPDATAGAAAPSGPMGGSKSRNDQRNRERHWRVANYYRNSNGTWTVAYQYVDGTVADIVAAMALAGYSVQVSAAGAGGAQDSAADSDSGLSFKTMSGGPGQLSWAGKFENSEGAQERGYVIQNIVITEVYTDKDGIVHYPDPMVFWEAFGPFAKGAQITGKNTIPDDCFCLVRDGKSGLYIVTGSARFYPMDALPPTFKTPNPDTRSGTAPSTIYDPHLSTLGASSVLNRLDIYSYGGN